MYVCITVKATKWLQSVIFANSFALHNLWEQLVICENIL